MTVYFLVVGAGKSGAEALAVLRDALGQPAGGAYSCVCAVPLSLRYTVIYQDGAGLTCNQNLATNPGGGKDKNGGRRTRGDRCGDATAFNSRTSNTVVCQDGLGTNFREEQNDRDCFLQGALASTGDCAARAASPATQQRRRHSTGFYSR